jgi:hypothetical protein
LIWLRLFETRLALPRIFSVRLVKSMTRMTARQPEREGISRAFRWGHQPGRDDATVNAAGRPAI